MMRPFYPEIVVAGVTDVPRVDHFIYYDDIVIVFRGGRPRARRVERCGAERATTLPKTDVYNQTRAATFLQIACDIAMIHDSLPNC